MIECHPIIKQVVHHIWPHALRSMQRRMLKRAVKTGITITCLALTPPAFKEAISLIPETTQAPFENLITPDDGIQDRHQQSVPEPSTWLIFSSASLIVILNNRRRS